MGMTLDEAITHAEEKAKEHEGKLKIYEGIDEDRPLFREEEMACKLCAEEHRQLAEWLKDYKRLKEQELETGYWFVDERHESDRKIICSNCEKPIFKYHKLDFDYRPKFCPNCGKRMGDS